ncbi:MAG: DNA repair protein RadC [Candidatus Nanoarchaeia archaeon]|nr:DNA repair protein RadC [Candidatus Nanoarchaeia archaeon]
MKIKDFQKVDRPREKLEKYGVEKLSDREILAIILRTGIKDKNVIELSQEVIKNIKKISIENVVLKGLGKTKAGQIISSIELGKRFLKNKKAELIMSPKDVWEKMEDLRDSKKEHFVVFFLDSRNQIIKREIISVGTLNSSLVHPREVFEPAIRYSTSQIIISHNHPSGLLKPSEEDLSMTKRLVEAGKILGIDILDHIIVCKNEYKSLRENNLI